MNDTVAPLLIVNEPPAADPRVGPAAVTHVSPVLGVPAMTVDHALVPVPVVATPATESVQEVGVALAVPVFCSVTVHVLVATEHVTSVALTCAELVNDPKRPKTNPATAMAAMSVIAMRITVARTGEIAFFFFCMSFSKFILLYSQVPVSGYKQNEFDIPITRLRDF
jgi:hypothetical protein